MKPETVTVPRWALEMALLGPYEGPLCNVCTGWSPSWDGHDRNPPCKGRAKEILREALDA